MQTAGLTVLPAQLIPPPLFNPNAGLTYEIGNALAQIGDSLDESAQGEEYSVLLPFGFPIFIFAGIYVSSLSLFTEMPIHDIEAIARCT